MLAAKEKQKIVNKEGAVREIRETLPGKKMSLKTGEVVVVEQRIGNRMKGARDGDGKKIVEKRKIKDAVVEVGGTVRNAKWTNGAHQEETEKIEMEINVDLEIATSSVQVPNGVERTEDGGVTIKEMTELLHREMQIDVEIEAGVDLMIEMLKGVHQEEVVAKIVGEDLDKMKEVLLVATEMVPFEEVEMTVALVMIEVLVVQRTVGPVEMIVALELEMIRVPLTGGLHQRNLTEMKNLRGGLNVVMIGEIEHR